MPYKVFAVGEEALAADVNNYLAEQSVARFTNATQRSSQLVAPEVNQLTMLDSRPGVVQYWTGSAWADLSKLIQAGAANVTPNGLGIATVTMPKPYAAPNAYSVVVSGYYGPTTTPPPIILAVLNAFTTSTFQVGITNATNGVAITTPIDIQWMAAGTAP